MAYNKRDSGFDEEQVKAFLKDALNKVETEADPDVLTSLKKIFKSTIPFTRRMYVAGYLAQLCSNGRAPRSFRERRNGREERNSRFERNESRERTERSPRAERSERKETETTERQERPVRVEIPEGLGTTIFVGIGRNRRVYPRDLVGLLTNVAKVDRERIGNIRVLANFSFVTLFTEDCEKAIAALNGYDYRGRSLNVSYARQGEAEETDAPAEDTTSVADDAAAVKASMNPNETIDAQAAFAAAEAAASEERAATDNQ